jgi:hypothetical protein
MDETVAFFLSRLGASERQGTRVVSIGCCGPGESSIQKPVAWSTSRRRCTWRQRAEETFKNLGVAYQQAPSTKVRFCGPSLHVPGTSR